MCWGGLYASAGDPKKTNHLTSLDGANQRLQLFKADLLEEGSFDSALEGCEGVFHTASPFYHDVKDPEVYLFLTSFFLLLLFIYSYHSELDDHRILLHV